MFVLFTLYYFKMEKLIELLNESTNGRFKSEQDLRLCIEMRWYCGEFIKWLVENDKIDLEKLDKPEYIDLWDDFMKLSDSDYLIMILSIQDNPIEYLCSILK